VDIAYLCQHLPLEAASCTGRLTNSVTGGYAGDLLSDAMANSAAGNIWITRQGHQNIVAVASLKDLAGIIIVQGAKPDADTLERAEKEGIPVLTTPLSAFDAAGKLYQLLYHAKAL